MEVFTEKYRLKSNNTIIMIFNMNQKHEILTSSTKRVPRKSIITYVIENPKGILNERKSILKNHASKLLYGSQLILATSILLIKTY